MRRAVALNIDRRAFIHIISEGQGDIGGIMQPLPEGLWGMPEGVLRARQEINAQFGGSVLGEMV
jgi:peptide/nickel transport system substrate-binding protein